MLKKLIYISIVFYLFIIYGQNLFEFGGSIRINFYFIGMSISRMLFAYCLYKAHKHYITTFLLFLCGGDLINELFFDASLSYLEIFFGILGVLILIVKDKKWINFF